MTEKLVERLSRAARLEALDHWDKNEGWKIVAETIDLMIEQAALELERRLITKKPSRRHDGFQVNSLCGFGVTENDGEANDKG